MEAVGRDTGFLDQMRGPHSPEEQLRLDREAREKRDCHDAAVGLRSLMDEGPVELVPEDDFFPFEIVTLRRVRHEDGEPTALVDIEGLRDGGMRSRRVRYIDLLVHADMHLEIAHGKGTDDPNSPRDFAHAVMRAAVACSMA